MATAREHGVVRGLRRRAAQGRCVELKVCERDLDREARTFEPVLAALDDVTPGVEVTRPGTCAFATRGPARYFGGEAALAELVLVRTGEAIGELAQMARRTRLLEWFVWGLLMMVG
ncbi:MAG: hypothetical protein OXN44_04260 [Acidimicrobiaceae bacterium]|nr:hypothetical protein [Acidimicrobiaceae bacterium]MDE0606127.1 hypothetical protein [Acidimicrobiaceae bacterium]